VSPVRTDRQLATKANDGCEQLSHSIVTDRRARLQPECHPCLCVLVEKLVWGPHVFTPPSTGLAPRPFPHLQGSQLKSLHHDSLSDLEKCHFVQSSATETSSVNAVPIGSRGPTSCSHTRPAAQIWRPYLVWSSSRTVLPIRPMGGPRIVTTPPEAAMASRRSSDATSWG
jgi:hypothetical protein